MVSLNQDKKKRSRLRKGAKTAPYITFGTKSVACLALFVVVYFICMMFFQPMLRDEEKATRFKSAKDHLVGKVRKESHAWKEEIQMARGNGRDKVEKQLMDKAWKQFLKGKQQKGKPNHANITNGKPDVLPPKARKQNVNDDKPTTGFMVLGMHRSGTSMLSGLLVDGFGYQPGKPLIGPAFDNEKGFFELIPAVLQNDAFMSNEQVNWAANVERYDAERVLEQTKQGNVNTAKLDKAIAVLNDPNNIPWLQKDPRMCITMRTWLPYLNSKPAIIFTYRHPLEVAMSIHKRDMGFTIIRGLKLWILYNKAAVQNSADLCRVLSNNNAVLDDPLAETMRISNELTTKCGVPVPPQQITAEIINSFIDPSLQHNKKQLEEKREGMKVLETHGGDCEVREFEGQFSEKTHPQLREKELKMYLMAMKIYCDFQSGDAYKSDYEWPKF